jgi:hypothetical protein
VAQYEVIIVQERFDFDAERLQNLSSLGRRFSVVRPHMYDLINGVTHSGYCAIARNHAIKFAHGDWVVFLAEASDPDDAWFADLERDLDEASRVGAAVSVSGNTLPEASRAGDVAYRLDILGALGGFEEADESEGHEDFLAQLDLVASGFMVVKGSRSCEL